MLLLSLINFANTWPSLIAAIPTAAPLQLALLGVVAIGAVGLVIRASLVGLALGGGGRRRLAAQRLGGRRRRHVGRRLTVGGIRRLRLHLFQQRILEQLLLDDFLELQRAELQQLDRLLQQRGHDHPLALSERVSGFHCLRRFSCPRTYRANFSPRSSCSSDS